MPFGTRYSHLLDPVGISLVALLLAGCSSSNLAPPTTLSSVSMSALTPPTSTLQSNQQQQFTVTVSGTSDTSVEWDIVDANGHVHYTGDSTVGTITAEGLYTAPTVSNPIRLTLFAGAAADTSVSRTATIAVNPIPPPVTVSVRPTTAVVQTCTQTPCPASSVVAFGATVQNATNTSVLWNVNGTIGGDSTVGTISSTGLYTAPASVPNPATVTVQAVSEADTTATGSASVTIATTPPPVTVSLNQSAVSLVAGQSFGFVATVANATNPAVTWSVGCPASNCGTVTGTGADTATYIAPSSISGSSLQVAVTATSVQDPTKTALATVAVTPVLQPSLSISFDPSLAPVHAGNTLLLTAQVKNLPANTPQPQIDWTQAASVFCISSDETGEVSTPFQDNCGDSDGEPDGPGKVLSDPNVTTQATYSAPTAIYDASTVPVGTFLGNNCPQATPTQPFVYVTAATTVNTTPLNASICIPVLP